MGNAQGSSLVNTTHIRQLASQIRNIDDCEALNVAMRQHMTQIANLVEAIVDVQLSQLTNFLPILKLPRPTPGAIVRWLRKLVLGTAYPQLQAYISYTLQLIQLAAAAVDLAAAAAEAADNIRRCALEVPQEIENAAKNELETRINNAINHSLSQVSNIQTLINTTANVNLVSFDTSSIQAFNQSVQTNAETTTQLVNDFLDLPEEDDPPEETTEEMIRRILAEQI